MYVDVFVSICWKIIIAGQGGLDPKVVAKSILEGVKDGVQGANLQYLKTIRIILLKVNVFLEFKAMAQQIFGGNTQLTGKDKSVPCRGNNSFYYICPCHAFK